VVNRTDFDNYKLSKETRKVYLNKDDFLKALKFALEVNFQGHTRTDFGTNRQRPFMQATQEQTILFQYSSNPSLNVCKQKGRSTKT
jgi:hypothetical protein